MKNQLLQFHRSERGVVTILVALALFVVFGFAAFTFDVGRALDESRRLQIAADSGSVGASRLMGSSPGISAVAQRACELAQANGLQSSDIDLVECGTYSGGTFMTACGMPCGGSSACNCGTASDSVRVVTRKAVLTTFAQLMGISSLIPSQQAVAKATFVTSGGSNCIRPFGVETAVLGNPEISVGQTFSIGAGAPGNWGKLDINGINMSSGQNFRTYMQSGICSASIELNQPLPVGTGFGGNLSTGFDYVLNQTFVIARTGPFPNGSGQVIVLEFLMVTYLGDNGRNGANWTGYLRLDGRNVTPPTAGGGTTSVSSVNLVK